MTVGFALLSAFMNALSAVLQRRATGQTPTGQLYNPQIFVAVLKNPLWTSGIILEVTAFFAQAAALHGGSLIVVEPLLTTDMIFLIAMLHFTGRRRISLASWIAMLLLTGGLAGLLVSTNPRGGIPATSFSHWFISFIIIASLITLGAIGMRRLNKTIRAVLGGMTAGLHFAFTALATKLVISQLHYGVMSEFTTWPLYALIIVGITSALSMQSMYGSGKLTITQPALEITEAIAGVCFGLLLFGDHITHGTFPLAMQALSGAVLLGGIVLLARDQAT